MRKIVFTVAQEFTSQSGNTLNVTATELAILLYLRTRELEGRGPATLEEIGADLIKVAKRRSIDGAMAGLKRKGLVERHLTFGISEPGRHALRAG